MTFRSDLVDLVNESHRLTWRRFDRVKASPASYGLSPLALARWKTPGEPAFVSGLLSHWTSAQLGQLMRRHLPTSALAGDPLVSGVFVHQKPYVEYGNPATRVEIGDLLLVRHHFTMGSPEPEGRAVLVQAKRSKTPKTGSLRGKDADQFDLYADWRKDLIFPHREPGTAPSGAFWNLSLGLGSPDETGRYGVVAASRPASGPRFPDECTWADGQARATCSGGRSVICLRSMAALLEGLLKGTGGRAWRSSAPLTDHWSHFVERMTASAAGWTYPLHSMASKALPRGRQLLMPLMAHLAAVRPPTALPSSLAGWFDEELETFIDRDRVASSVDQGISEWLGSVELAGGSGGDDGGGSMEPEIPGLDGLGGGMSVLYIATIGKSPLERQTQAEKHE